MTELTGGLIQMTREEYKQLRKRAVDDVDGADKELAMLLKERRGL